jgi:hypothetical protein
MGEAFDGLRAYVGGAVRQPDFGVVQGRARRLYRRRVIITSAVTAVVVAVGLGLAARGEPDRHTMPVTPAPQPSPNSSFNRQNHNAFLFAGGVHNLYAVAGDCMGCSDRLFASADDGATWQRRSRPPAPKGGTGVADVDALGPQLIAWGWVPADLRTLADDKKYQYVSVDGGVTWRPIVVDATPVAAVPAGTAPVDCASVNRVAGCRVYAADPVTGHFAPLAAQPAGFDLDPDWIGRARPTIGAGIYLPGTDPVTRKPAVAASSDGGLTWQTTVLAAGTAVGKGSFAATFITAGANGVAYADADRDPSDRLVYRTTDGGRTWTPGATMSESASSGVVTPDGGDLTQPDPMDHTKFEISRAGGPYQPITVNVQNSPDPVSAQQPVLGLYVQALPPVAAFVSTDTVTWREIVLPDR